MYDYEIHKLNLDIVLYPTNNFCQELWSKVKILPGQAHDFATPSHLSATRFWPKILGPREFSVWRFVDSSFWVERTTHTHCQCFWWPGSLEDAVNQKVKYLFWLNHSSNYGNIWGNPVSSTLGKFVGISSKAHSFLYPGWAVMSQVTIATGQRKGWMNGPCPQSGWVSD